ncbi:EcsC family protein [Methylocystis heyeri]|uniref:EcsC family protein n=1 Tax=Methylocystis heyeri TaxID=391905 RepID=A0A6B8KEJ8_9HYPH|nr:EcsC family protein [Methylocystis heyeri]QGM44863.1 EcsC family protein [Methylocystis heyeri]
MATTLPVAINSLTSADLAALEEAVAALERSSFARKLSHMVGNRISFAGRALPEKLQYIGSLAARRALESALGVALNSLRGKPISADARLRHRQLAMVSGALGGAMGLASLPVELPISTTIMLRAIADIARQEGEDLTDPTAAMACLEVFALGGHGEEGKVMEGGYLALRGLFAKTVSDAAAYVTHTGVVSESAPALARLIGAIAGRFGVVVSQKTAAQAAPIIGAISGAVINVAFTEHFQTLARGHFTVRRLERAYGPHEIRAEYARIARASGFWPQESAGAA